MCPSPKRTLLSRPIEFRSRCFHIRESLDKLYDRDMRDALSAILSENIQRYIKLRGLNGKQLSRECGLGETAVFDIINERSSSPRLSTIVKIANGLDVSVIDLLSSEPTVSREARIASLLRDASEDDLDRLERVFKALSVPD